MGLIVGTFNTPHLYTLTFTPPTPTTPASLKLQSKHPAIGSHSWLALNATKDRLYATAWTDPPSIAAYSLTRGVPKLLNTAVTAARSGYVCCDDKYVYSAGGSSGEVFALRPDGGLGACVQRLSFVDSVATGGDGGEARPHGDFGGLRHGAHSIDLSPDGRSVYVADIGRNCVWAFSVNEAPKALGNGELEVLTLGGKHVAPRGNDGPRHTAPHPNGRVLYSLQEHSCMVDVFGVEGDGTGLRHRQGVRIIPEGRDEKMYWADEVRVSKVEGTKPRFLWASTRGLKKETMGYVAVFKLDEEGLVEGDAIDIFETATSGGWANAIEPVQSEGDVEYAALTDSEEGLVFILQFDGKKVSEVARRSIREEGAIDGAATAVWL